jgi:hypothetical protein
MTDHGTILARPHAGALIESMRAFGYSLPTAVADIIDNSIAAEATVVEIRAAWRGPETTLTITDDGRGMKPTALVEAMRLGTAGPSAARRNDDLGRFGLGLKTASLSQARRLAVSSRPAPGAPARAYAWDIDHVVETDDWELLGLEPEGPLDPPASGGTVVMWQRLDRVVDDSAAEDRRSEDRFLARLRELEQHLSMVFHRFLHGGRLRLVLNGNDVRPWDPFLLGNPATQRLGEEQLGSRDSPVRVRPYVLPHISRLTAAEHEEAAGPSGWNGQQGFYVYRNDRLLVSGGWLQLGMKREEHFKLARIQVDIPSSLDSSWQIDVRKSVARPPTAVAEDLRRIARATRKAASDVYRHRGKIITQRTSQAHVLLWSQRIRHAKLSYGINRQHPLVQAVFKRHSETADDLEALLRLLEETIPLPTIVMSHAERPDDHSAPFEVSREGALLVLRQVWKALIEDGLTRSAARERLYSMEPFSSMPDLLAAFESEIDDPSQSLPS